MRRALRVRFPLRPFRLVLLLSGPTKRPAVLHRGGLHPTRISRLRRSSSIGLRASLPLWPTPRGSAMPARTSMQVRGILNQKCVRATEANAKYLFSPIF